MSDVTVIKATGERVPFDEQKVLSSIKRAGIPDTLQPQVLAHVREKLFPDIHTSEIYRHIIEFLSQSPYPHTRSRYSLKQAIMDFGPTGFPFEKFIAAILHEQGYLTETDVVMKGKCVEHEIDVLAKKDSQQIIVECKFHNRVGIRTDVKVALYVMARFQDLMAGDLIKEKNSPLHQIWLVTNTKCSQSAIEYAKCMGLHIVSWGYPEDNNLQKLVEEKKLHPVTCLSGLSNYHKKLLLSNDIVLCKHLIDNHQAFELLKLPDSQRKLVTAQIQAL